MKTTINIINLVSIVIALIFILVAIINAINATSVSNQSAAIGWGCAGAWALTTIFWIITSSINEKNI